MLISSRRSALNEWKPNCRPPVLKAAWTGAVDVNPDYRPDLTSISETFWSFRALGRRATTKLRSTLAQISSSPDKTFSGAYLEVVTTTR